VKLMSSLRYTYSTYIAASGTAIDNVAHYIAHRIFTLTFNIPVLPYIFYFDEKSPIRFFIDNY